MTATVKVETLKIQIAAEAIRREETGKSLKEIGKEFGGISARTVSRYAEKFNDEALDYIEEHYNQKLDEADTKPEVKAEEEQVADEDHEEPFEVEMPEPEESAEAADDDAEVETNEEQETVETEPEPEPASVKKPGMTLADEIAAKIEARRQQEARKKGGDASQPSHKDAQATKPEAKGEGTGRGRRITSQRDDVKEAMEKIRGMKGSVLSDSGKVMPFPTSVALEEYLDAKGDRNTYVENMKARGYSGSSIQQGWFRAEAYLGEEKKGLNSTALK